jgi:pyruvate formate lyase activating enzyme
VPQILRIIEWPDRLCGVRQNVRGKLVALNYGKACSVAMDPIEKKPLFHFAPGTRCLSFATVGCNFHCRHCQNCEISQEFGSVYGEDLSPKGLVGLALEQKAEGIAYTYVEPTIFFEYAYDTMKLARKSGLYNVWVSNGYTSPGAIKKMKGLLDAVNVDLKGNDGFYKKICMAWDGYDRVLESLKLYQKLGIFLEVTNLIIPGYNDSDGEIKQMVNWITGNLGPEVPLHFSAFYPYYKLLDAKPTPLKTLERAYDIAKEAGIRYVYVGNVRHRNESTYCPKCGEIVIKRDGYFVSKISDECACGEKILLEGRKWI